MRPRCRTKHGVAVYAMSKQGHDAFDKNGDVQIKRTAKKMVAMYATSIRLVVLRAVSPRQAEIVYDGPGDPVWKRARPNARNNQRAISLRQLKAIAE